MTGELNLAGIYLSPLLACFFAAFVARMAISRLLTVMGLYRFIWQRPLFDLALFLLCVWLAFAGLRLMTS